MAEIKIQDILFKIQQFKDQNPQKVKGLNDEQVVSIMFQEGKLPEEAKKQLAQILSGQYVKEEGTFLGQKSYTFIGKDKAGNLKRDVYIDFNGDNVADLKIFDNSIFVSTQVNGQITDWTRTNDYDEFKSAVIDTVEINNAPVSTGKEEPAKIPEDKEKLAKKEANIKEHLIQIFRDDELKELFLSVSPETQNALLNKDPKKLGITKSGIPSHKYKKAVKEFLEDNCKDNNEIRNAYLTSHDREDLAKFFLKPLAEQEKLLNSDNIMQSFAPQKIVNPQAEAAKLERLKRKFLSNADEKTKEYFKQLDNEGQRLFLYAYEHDFKHQTFKNASSFKEFVLNDFLERHKVSQEELEEREAANNVKRQRRDFVSSADEETTITEPQETEGKKIDPQIFASLGIKRVPGNKNLGEQVKYEDNWDSKGQIYKTKKVIPGDSKRAILFEGATPEAQQAILRGEINLKDIDKYLEENQLAPNKPENAARLKYIERCSDEELLNFLMLPPEEQKKVDLKLRTWQEDALNSWKDRISKFKTAVECQIAMDMLIEVCQKEGCLENIKLVIDAMEAKLQTFPKKDVEKVKDPKWQEEMRIARELNGMVQECLWRKYRQMQSSHIEWVDNMGWAEQVGQWFCDDIEAAEAEIERFRASVEKLSKLQNLTTDEEYGAQIKALLGNNGYDVKHIKKVQKNHPAYVQLVSAKNTVEQLVNISKQDYTSMNLLHAESQFGREGEIIKYIPNYKSLPPQKKFKALQELAKKTIPVARQQLETILGGRNYDEEVKKHEQDYAKFLKMVGVSDVETKLAEYKQSAAEAGGWVKCGITVVGTLALTIATGGAGGVLAAGVIAGGTSAAVEVTDRASNGYDDLSSKEDWLEIGKTAAVDGVSTVAGMKIGGKILGTTWGKYTKFGASVASDTAIGFAAEFAQTGQVTWQGALMGTAMAGAGNGIAIYAAGKGARAYKPDQNLPAYRPPIDGQPAIVNTNKVSDVLEILEAANVKKATGELKVLSKLYTKELTNNQVTILNMLANCDNKANLSMDLIDKLLAKGDPKFADACLSRNLDFANLPPEKHDTLVELHTAVDENGMPKYPNLTLDDVMAYDPKKAKLFDKAYSITRIFGQDRSSIQKAMSKPQRVDAIIEFFEKNKDYIKNQEQIDFLFSCTDAEFKDAIKKMKQTALQNRLVINSNLGIPDISNFPNLSKIDSPKTVNDLLNNKSLTDIEKAVLEETYEHLCDLGLKDKIDADPALLLNLSKNKYNLGVDATKLSKADIETILYAREQYKKGLISEAEQNQVLERMNMGTPAELFKYIDTPENLIPETVTIKRTWGEQTYTKEQIIKWAKGDRVLRKLLDRQSTPVDLTVHRIDGDSIYKDIKIGDKSLESLLAEGKSPEEIVEIINNSATSSSMQFDNFIGTSLGGSLGFTNKTAVRWEIEAPKGTKGAHLDSLVNPVEYMGENEFLLQAGTTLRIKEARYENGQFILKAVVDQDSCKKLTPAEQPTSLTRAAEITPTSAHPAAEAVPLKSSKTNLDTDSTQAKTQTTKPPTYTDEQLSEIMQKYKIREFDRAMLERLATHAPETLENILKNSKEPKALSTLLWILRDIPDEELKNLKGNMPIPKRIKSKNLPPELQQEYMNILLSDNDLILYKLDLSDSVTCQKILENIKKIPEGELVVINNTLSNSLDPVAIKKAMEKIGLSDDDIPINNNQQLTKEARDLLTDIICSRFDFTTAEINEILQSGDSKLHEIRFQKAQKKIMLTEGVINNGQKLSPAQKQRILDLAYNTDQKYTSDEINKILNAPDEEVDALVDLYTKKPENYSLTLGEDLRIDSKSTILEVNGSEKYLIDMNTEDMQAAINKLKDGESFTIIRGNINPQDPALSPILAIVKKENGQIIIQNCSVNGITINPNINIPKNNVRSNNSKISANYESIMEAYNTFPKKNFILAKLFENPELKKINSEWICDIFYLNCSDELYAKIVAGEKITVQTLKDLRIKGFTRLLKNQNNKVALEELLKSHEISLEDVVKIIHAEDFILKKVMDEVAAGKKITPELFNKITSDAIIEQIQKGQCKFSASDKQIVDTILNSPYAKDFTSTELINILSNEKYRQIVLGQIKDGKPIMKELFMPIDELSIDFIMAQIEKKTSVYQINKDEHFSLTYEQKKNIAKAIIETNEFGEIILVDFLRIMEDKKCMKSAIHLIDNDLPIRFYNFLPDFEYQSSQALTHLRQQHSTSTLLNISNKELHKKSSVNTKLYAKGYPEIHQSVIDYYYKNPVQNQQYINGIVPIGEIRKTSDGTLYYNSGNELIKIGLNEETLRDIFPASMAHKLKQGSIGNCWLISVLGALENTPVGKGQILKLFSQHGDIISLKLPNATEPTKFKRIKIGEINLDSSKFGQKTMSSYAYIPINLKNITSQSYTELVITSGNAKKIINKTGTEYTLRASKGLRMLELACADLRADDLFKGSKTIYHSADELMNSFDFLSMKKILDGGYTTDAINLICGLHNTNRIIDKLDLSKVDVNAYMDFIEKHIKNPNSIIVFGLKGNDDNFYWNKEFDLVKQHAYRVVGVNKAKGTIIISNPHHNNMPIEIPIVQWIRYVAHCEVIDIR